jgi:hypothetical protein
MSPKPLYDRLMELVWDEWATHYSASLDDDAALTVPCAAGEHFLELRLPSGDRLTGAFGVVKGQQGPITISLGQAQ